MKNKGLLIPKKAVCLTIQTGLLMLDKEDIFC